jgi:DNA-binding MarR family transcriptional regulator
MGASGRLPFDPIEEARGHWVERGWGDAAEGMAMITSLMRSQQLLLSRVDGALRPFGLTLARYEVLMLLLFSQNGALPLSKVGSRLQVHPTSVTSAIDRLERQSFVRRRPHPTDRRTTLAELTDAGRDVALRATERVNAEAFAVPGVERDDMLELTRILRDFRARSGDF